MFKKKKKKEIKKPNITFYREDGTSWKEHAEVGESLDKVLQEAKRKGATYFMAQGSKGGGFMKEIK